MLHLKAQLPILLPTVSTVMQAAKAGMNRKRYKLQIITAAFYSFHFQYLVNGHTLFEKNFLKLTIYMKRGTMLCNAPIYCPRATLNLSI